MTSALATPPADERVGGDQRLDLVAVVAVRHDHAARARDPAAGDEEAARGVLLVQPRHVIAHQRVDLVQRLEVAEQHDEHEPRTLPAHAVSGSSRWCLPSLWDSTAATSQPASPCASVQYSKIARPLRWRAVIATTARPPDSPT